MTRLRTLATLLLALLDVALVYLMMLMLAGE
jgi:hypothetical protein